MLTLIDQRLDLPSRQHPAATGDTFGGHVLNDTPTSLHVYVLLVHSLTSSLPPQPTETHPASHLAFSASSFDGRSWDAS